MGLTSGTKLGPYEIVSPLGTCLDTGCTSKTLCSIWFATNRRLSGRGSLEAPGGRRRHAKKQIPGKRWFTMAPFFERESSSQLTGSVALAATLEVLHTESMQSCGVITLRPRPGAVPRLAGNPGANVEMRFPRCHSARECEHRGNSGQCAGSISSVASSPFVWRQSR
jgi:hypothetical protein